MYTAKILRTQVDKQLKRLYVDVSYHLDDGVRPEVTEQLNFPLGTDKYEVAYRIKKEVSFLEKSEINFAGISVGDVDITLADALAPSASQIAEREWFSNFDRLRKVVELSQLGALPPVHIDKLEALRQKVQIDFKPVYINKM